MINTSILTQTEQENILSTPRFELRPLGGTKDALANSATPTLLRGKYSQHPKTGRSGFGTVIFRTLFESGF